MKKEFFTTTQLAKILGISRIAVFKRIKAGKIDAIKDGRDFLIPINSIKEIVSLGCGVVGIDEIHMFPDDDAKYVSGLLRWGTRVVISGLDTDYRGRMFEIVKNLLELGPNAVHYKRAVCDNCRQPEAIYTQVLKDGVPVLKDMPPSIPDDGTHTYLAVCRRCFKKLN